MIQGPNLTLRPIRLSDHLAIADIKSDWPVDAQGAWNIHRAVASTELWFQETTSGGPTTLVADSATDRGVAMVRFQAHRVTDLAVAPQHRGNGHYRERWILLGKYFFRELGRSEVTFDVLPTAAAVLADAGKGRHEDRGSGSASQVANRTLNAHRVTSTAFEGWMAANVEEDAATFVVVR